MGGVRRQCVGDREWPGAVYFDAVTMFTFFLLTARHLEMAARHRALRTTEALARLVPLMARRIEGGNDELVPAAELMTGDRVLIRPGESIPADGTVLEGSSTVDEGLITGESLPRPRRDGDSLVAGSVNREGPLVMRVVKAGSETLLSSIIRLLDRAQAEKPAVARLADRVAGWFVHAIEALARATHVVFDKTGTLTEGAFKLEEVVPLRDLPVREALEIAAALDHRSEHPIAKALLCASHGSLEALGVHVTPGEGVTGVGLRAPVPVGDGRVRKCGGRRREGAAGSRRGRRSHLGGFGGRPWTVGLVRLQ